MQVLRQGLTTAFQRSSTWTCSSIMMQQMRWEGSDPRTSTSSENHKKGSSDLNKSKGGNKKQKSTTTDDTNQPGVKRKDWNRPDQVTNNDPQYGKAGSPSKAKK